MQAYIQNQLNLYEGNPLGYSNLPYLLEVNLNQPLIYHQTRTLFDVKVFNIISIFLDIDISAF